MYRICYFILFFIVITILYKQSISSSYNTMVDFRLSGEPGTIIDGTPTYSTITEALSLVPELNEKPFKIYIKKGIYYEKISVDKPKVYFIGESRDETIIRYDASGDTFDPEGKKYSTYGCFTLRITAPEFHAENLTIENSFDYPANAQKFYDDPTKVHNPQAVALMTDLNNDRVVFHNCKFIGYQDTIFTNAGRHYFYQCSILGHVDFIFGAGQAVFDECDIISRNRIGKNPTGYVTAPSTLIKYPYGFLFLDCRLIKESQDIPKGSVRLGRPWHPGGNLNVSGNAVFFHCYMDDHIGSQGYDRISSTDSTGNKIWFELEPDSRFFEYQSYGPGAISSPDRPTLDDASAKWYTTDHVLNGWIP